MKEIFNIAWNYVQDEKGFMPIVRILNLILLVNISSFVFESIYGKYEWINYSEYDKIMDFFVKGNFIIPLVIFLLVTGTTYLIASIIFILITHFKSIEYQRRILAYQYNRAKIDSRLEEIKQVSTIVTPIDLTPEIIVSAYEELKNKIGVEDYQKSIDSSKKSKNAIQNYFSVLFRAIIAATIFKITLPNFGWIFYFIVLLMIIIGMYFSVVIYRFLDTLPTLFRKFNLLAEQYLSEYLQSKQS